MKLIIGLGNPGAEYENTRHNIGFQVIDHYAMDNNWKNKFDGLYQKITVGTESVILLKPQTFMNNSGFSVLNIIHFFHINVEDVLVIQDDLDIPFGTYRLKRNSSSGGHNGIQSIINQLGTNVFLRLKIGVSHDRGIDTANYVLGKFSKEELSILSDSYKQYSNIIQSFVLNGIEKTLLLYSKK